MSDSTPQGLLVASNANEPAGYRGLIQTGNLSPGVWTLRIDDSTWPTNAPQRRNYLKANRYVHDAANQVFRATFTMDEASLQIIMADLQFDWVPVQLTMEAVDADNDGVFDNTELNGNQTVFASVDASCGGSAPVCGGQDRRMAPFSVTAVSSSARPSSGPSPPKPALPPSPGHSGES